MIESRRLLTLAAAVILILAGRASAQTVLVRNAPPDSTIDVALNSDPAGSGKADGRGIATIAINMAKGLNKTEADVQIFVDVCSDMRRVIIAERAVILPAPESGCTRRDMGGIFLVRNVSTLVVDFAGPTPTLLLRQGYVSPEPKRIYGPPSGLILFGGGGMTMLANETSYACGSITPECDRDDIGLGFTGGASFWFGQYIGAEGSYVRPAKGTATGSGSTYTFDSTFDPEMLTVAGMVGAPVRTVRIYGKVGANYHQATFRTNQTNQDITVTVDGVQQTIEGGTQTYWVKTNGWGWLFGGGLEVWIGPHFGIYGEVTRAALKGEPRDDEEGVAQEGITDERTTTFFAGIRIKIGG